ncbi:uncharacterized protein C8A04DRAFT_15127 [Dichotomopilus funicola]|uniref:Uncharacterized protein n=1 Tax=Dichotomopilus funicola TaxID=1934379 RepID=A0AAN6ZIA1_9PEZI|nr:hypothetical protein C8A04DRAFT_15127 [Dichotomopilus funicola]
MSRSQAYEPLRGSEAPSPTDPPSPTQLKDAEEGHAGSGSNFGGDEERAQGAEREAPISLKQAIAPLTTAVKLWFVMSLLLVIVVFIPEWPKDVEVAGDITGFARQISGHITTFVPNPAFVPENGSAFFTDEVQDKWLSIVPKGLGYVQINDTSRYKNLPNPLKSHPDSTFTTSVTHQLHCLHAIVGVVAAYTSNRLDKLPQEGTWHLNHCFDYLRQSIMCCGDMALEGQQTSFPAGFVGSDGWDAIHMCKD